MKRNRNAEDTSKRGRSKASQFNAIVLKKLQNALRNDPEADLASVIPSNYSERLASRKERAVCELGDPAPFAQENTQPVYLENDVRFLLQPSDHVRIVHQIASSVQHLIMNNTTPPGASNSEIEGRLLIRLLQQSRVIGRSLVPSRRIVLKCSDSVVAKLTCDSEDFTEYSTLQYLRQCQKELPVPEPLGLLCMGRVSITFMSYVPGSTLDSIWTQLGMDQKTSVRDQLQAIFTDLRKLAYPDSALLGGVNGEGCKDQRRHLRRCTTPITNASEFEDFQFSHPKYGSQIFVNFLRAFTTGTSRRIVFTHGDLRPENIIIEVSGDGCCMVKGIIDWENSGFYPEYYEATKVTNCLGTNEDCDWYEFLPSCISPHSEDYRVRWLVDYQWGRHLE